jgi:hypothetical protein
VNLTAAEQNCREQGLSLAIRAFWEKGQSEHFCRL